MPDDARLLRSTLDEAAATCDAVVTSGGVSMGEHDLVKQVLADLGRIEFWQVAMQPAKPFAFGFVGATPLFGLPGNPVSAMVAFEQFVRPGLLAAMGANRLFRPRFPAVVTEALSTNPDKVVFVRVAVCRSGGMVRSAGAPGFQRLVGLGGGRCLRRDPGGSGGRDRRRWGDARDDSGPESRTLEEVRRWTELTHLDDQGRARMVDVSAKPETERRRPPRPRHLSPATRGGCLRRHPPQGRCPGGGENRRHHRRQADRRPDPALPPDPAHRGRAPTWSEPTQDGARVVVTATHRRAHRGGDGGDHRGRHWGRSPFYDMVKGLDRGAEIGPVRLIAKSGGRSGEWHR